MFNVGIKPIGLDEQSSDQNEYLSNSRHLDYLKFSNVPNNSCLNSN